MTEFDLSPGLQVASKIKEIALPLPSRVFRRLARHVMTAGLRSGHVRVQGAGID